MALGVVRRTIGPSFLMKFNQPWQIAVTIEERTEPKWLGWTGSVLSGLTILFPLMDATMKLMQLPIVVETTSQLG
jgi:hypothetical protein